MRGIYFLTIQLILISALAYLVYFHKDRVLILKTPPASLSKWYKPENKRQVWLHNMFKLRREMQAIKIYSGQKDSERLEKWLEQFITHYKKIGEMVPEWENKLNMQALSQLETNQKNENYEGITENLELLVAGCENCHNDYRTTVATLYRTPNFKPIKVGASTSFKEHMGELSQQVNQIKIASEDGLPEIALSSWSRLDSGIKSLGKTCSTCHKKDIREYPDATVRSTLDRLKQSLTSGTIKDQGRNLGTLAVLACARCHGTHRFSYENRVNFKQEKSLIDLIRH